MFNKSNAVYFMAGIAATLVFNIAHRDDKPVDTYNTVERYGDTGLPKNCRAIIAVNVREFQAGGYPAHEALNSIDRNCGAVGHSWEPY